MQIAGKTCDRCKRPIVFFDEGRYCSHCRVFFHIACDPRRVCGICRNPYECEEPRSSNPTDDAILPRALRPRSSGLSTPFLILAAVVATLIVLALLALPCGKGA